MARQRCLIAIISLDDIVVSNQVPWTTMKLLKKIINGSIKWHSDTNQLVNVSSNTSTSLITDQNMFQNIKNQIFYQCKPIVIDKHHKNTSNVTYTQRFNNAIVKCDPKSELIYFGGHDIFRECLDQALCPILYIFRMKYYLKSRNCSKTINYSRINDSIYEKVSEPINNDRFILQIYIWTSEYCQALIHEQKNKIM